MELYVIQLIYMNRSTITLKLSITTKFSALGQLIVNGRLLFKDNRKPVKDAIITLVNSARMVTFALLICLSMFFHDTRAQFTFDPSIKVDGVGLPIDLAIEDFDGNGYKDMAYITAPDGKLHVLYNNGTYAYTNSSIAAGGVNYDFRIMTADFNKDGKSDLAVVNRNNPVSERLIILLSIGTSFVKTNFSIPGPSDIYAIATDDFDNDGNADVLVPNVGQSLTWYKGNGLGGFTQQTDNNIIGGSSLAVADFNNDSKKDLVIGRGQQFDVHLSSGSTFSKTTISLGTNPVYLIATDINNDNNVDIVGSFSNSTVYIGQLINNGTGGFSGLVLIPTSTSVSSRLTNSDFNGDGLQDLAIATYNGTGPVILLNAGSTFTSIPFNDERVNQIQSIAFADLDNNSEPELVCLSGWPSLSILQRAGSNFQLAHKQILGSIPCRGLSRDIDKDGNFDLVSASLSNGAVIIKQGKGDLTFGDNSSLLGTGYRVEYVETADFNSDGYDDLLFMELYLSGNTKIKLSLTDNQGHYQTPFEINQASGITITTGDFNNDGKQDFFCSTGVFIGNGAGSFSQLPLSLGTLGVNPYYARIVNLNNDGAPDLVVGDAVNAWTLMNSGNGNFAAPIILNTTKRIARLDVGNYDTDGLTDIFTISDNNTFSVFKNMGSGMFQENVFPVQQPLTISDVNVFTVADFNHDGHADLAIRVTRNSIPELAVYVQNQNNSFRLKTELLCESDGIQDLVSADLNNDGGQDLILFSISKGIEVFAGFFISEPTTQAGAITIIDRTDVTAKLGFVKGTGDGRIVLLRKNTFPSAIPEDDAFYSANSQFGQGDNIGGNNFVVMRGDQAEVTITGLQAGTDYVATVFEYHDNFQKSINNYLTASYPTVAFKTKNNQIISFSSINNKTEGDAPFLISAQASSGLPVELNTSSTNVSLNLGQVIISGPGPVTIKATQAGNEDYMPAPEVSRTFCVNPLPPVVTMTVSGTQLILTSSSNSNNQWIRNGQPIPGATDKSYVAQSGGTYIVKVDYGGCMATSEIVTGIDEIPRMDVWPNPAHDTIIIHGIEVGVVTLTSSQGKQFQLSAEKHRGESHVDISALPAGLYLLSPGYGEQIKVLIKR